jgi:hypothetical protein
MDYSAGQQTGDKYRSRLISHFSDSNNAVEVCQGCSEETKADYLRSHYRPNNISSKTYREGGYDGLAGVTVNSKEYQED